MLLAKNAKSWNLKCGQKNTLKIEMIRVSADQIKVELIYLPFKVWNLNLEKFSVVHKT